MITLLLLKCLISNSEMFIIYKLLLTKHLIFQCACLAHKPFNKTDRQNTFCQLSVRPERMLPFQKLMPVLLKCIFTFLSPDRVRRTYSLLDGQHTFYSDNCITLGIICTSLGVSTDQMHVPVNILYLRMLDQCRPNLLFVRSH